MTIGRGGGGRLDMATRVVDGACLVALNAAERVGLGGNGLFEGRWLRPTQRDLGEPMRLGRRINSRAAHYC